MSDEPENKKELWITMISSDAVDKLTPDIKLMHLLYGQHVSERCGQCEHLVLNNHGDYVSTECESSEDTGINKQEFRTYFPACGLFVQAHRLWREATHETNP